MTADDEKRKKKRRIVIAAVCLPLAITALMYGFRAVYNWDTIALHTAVKGAGRLRVRTRGGCCRNVPLEETLVEVTDPRELRAFVRKIRVENSWLGASHCSCCGWPTLEFYRGSALLATVSVHHGHGLRWHDGKWNGDRTLREASGEFLRGWLELRGATKEEWERRQPEVLSER
ncbi:MAG: hypothetical protein ACYTGB_03425 [Planctomycetota bacterium]|jgi:hypothetical protein